MPKKLFSKSDYKIVIRAFLFIVAFFVILYYSIDVYEYSKVKRRIKDFIKDGKDDEAMLTIQESSIKYGESKELFEIALDILFREQEASVEEKRDDMSGWITLLNYTTFVRGHFWFVDKELQGKMLFYDFKAYYHMGKNYYPNIVGMYPSIRGNPQFQSDEVQQEVVEVLEEEKKYDEALEVVGALIKKDPNNLLFQFRNAMILHKMGRVNHGLQEMREMVFGVSGYNSYISDVALFLVGEMKERMLYDEVDYFYRYMIEKSNHDPLWVDGYKNFLSEFGGLFKSGEWTLKRGSANVSRGD